MTLVLPGFVPEDPFDPFDGVPDEPSDPDHLRSYQREAYNAITAALNMHRSTIAVMATSSGKTQVATAIAKHWPEGHVLFLVERGELVEQTAKTFERMGLKVDVEQADHFCSTYSRYVVGTVQSVCQKKRLERLGERFTFIIIDEFHHATAKTYRRIMDAMPWAKVLGLTATPDRADEKALGQVCESVAYVYDILHGIEDGWLVPYVGCQVHVGEIDISQVSTSMGDLAEGQLDEAMVKAAKAIAKKTLELYPDKHGIVFMPGIKSAELTAACFNELKPDSAEFICGHTHEAFRESAVRRFRCGEVQFLVNCQLTTEGFDAPICDLIVMGRLTKSHTLYCQMAGRGGRPFLAGLELYPFPEDAEKRRRAIATSKKPNCTLLDFCGNSGRHTLVTPVDILGGDYSQEIREKTKKLLKDGETGDIREMLKRVKAEEASRAFRLNKLVAESRPFDPFQLLGVQLDPQWRQATRYGVRAASPGYIECLKRIGIPNEELHGMSMRGARAIMRAADARRKAGLCTYKQLLVLKRHGVADTNITFRNACIALDWLSSNGWPKNPNMRTLLQILGGTE